MFKMYFSCLNSAVFSPIDTPAEFPIAVSSKQVRDVLKSELSTSVPIAAPVIAVGRSGHQVGVLHSKEEDTQLHTSAEAVHPQEGATTGNCPERQHPLTFLSCFCSVLDPCTSLPASSPLSSLRSIMKRKAEGEPGSPTTKKNLQFIGVNGG